VTEDSYQKGVNYNQTLEQVKKQNDLGWQVSIQYQRMTEIKGAIMLKVLDKNSVPLKNPQIYINFRRPTQEGFDFIKNIDPIDGVYRTVVDFPMSGQWDALIVVRSGDDVYQEVKRYVIQ
jgi:nitrogen fixation protein FixH